MLCRNVPIARTGSQVYYEGEVPVSPAQPYGEIIILREEAEVFHPEAIASFEGKPITMHHPEDSVTPENWKELSLGHGQNVRRGTGLDSDLLLSDMLICDAAAIRDVLEDKIREISCGYEADYEEIEPGKGRQKNIRGNHIALVERGRCGVTCAIHDHKVGDIGISEYKGYTIRYDPATDITQIKKGGTVIASYERISNEEAKKKIDENKWTKDEKGGSMKGKLKAFFKSLTGDEAKELGINTQDSLTTDERLDRVEKQIGTLIKLIKDAAFEGKETAEEEEEEAKKKKAADEAAEEEAKKKKETEDEEEEKAKMKDAASVMQDTLYRASIIAPDLKPFTTDAIKNSKTLDETCCLHKRKALDAAYKTEDGKAAIALFTKDTDFLATNDCRAIDVAFMGASEVMKAKASDHRVSHRTGDGILKGGVTPAALNARFAQVWKDREGGK